MKRQLSFENEKELILVGKALSSEIRIRILKLLDENPLCVNEIAEILQLSLIHIYSSCGVCHKRGDGEARAYGL